MPTHNVQCSKCGLTCEHTESPWPSSPVRHDDGGEFEILWQSTPRTATVHPRERSVVYRNPRTGDVAYPPRNDAPMPSRYASAGYERVEFETARSLERFEREKGVCNEKLWFNSGKE